MKLLIIRFSSIGDIVLTTPVIRCLKQQVITAQVHYLTKKSFAPIFAANPFVDKMHYLSDDNFNEVVSQLQQEDFDYVIDLHHNLRTLKVKRALGKQSFSFNKLNIEKWLLTALKIHKLPSEHIVDRYLQTLQSFGVKNDGNGLDYFIPEKDEVSSADIPATHHAGYIGLVIGGALQTKKFPLEKLKRLCTAIQHPIMLLGGKEDMADGEELAALDKFKIYNACGKFNINESASLVRQAKFIITNDTGLMHVAAAFNKPVISLWGNTVPEFGMTAYYVNKSGSIKDTRFEIKNLSCRPCSKIGYDKCPKGHFNCMQKIDDAVLLETVKQYIGLYKH